MGSLRISSSGGMIELVRLSHPKATEVTYRIGPRWSRELTSQVPELLQPLQGLGAEPRLVHLESIHLAEFDEWIGKQSRASFFNLDGRRLIILP